MNTFLTSRLLDAILYAILAHEGDVRKGDDLPYIVHPIAVFGLLSLWGANEDTCIAGLLHDVIEEAPEGLRSYRREQIEEFFEKSVSDIVEEVTEKDKTLPWKERKILALEKLKTAQEPTLLVSCADKTHNAISLWRAYLLHGAAVWERFNASREEKLWHLQSALHIFSERLDPRYTGELRVNIEGLTKASGEKLICLISTEGKLEEQIVSEVGDAMKKYEKHQKETNATYQVFVDDNFHYMDESERYLKGTYDSLEEAERICKLIVKESLLHLYKPGMTPEELYDAYVAMGEDPWICGCESSDDLSVPFSAWKYAKERAGDICDEQ